MWVFSVKQGLESVPQLATAHSPLRGSQMPSEASVAFFPLQVPPKRGQRLAPLDTVCHDLINLRNLRNYLIFLLTLTETVVYCDQTQKCYGCPLSAPSYGRLWRQVRLSTTESDNSNNNKIIKPHLGGSKSESDEALDRVWQTPRLNWDLYHA